MLRRLHGVKRLVEDVALVLLAVALGIVPLA
jgi:hypothetical protein